MDLGDQAALIEKLTEMNRRLRRLRERLEDERVDVVDGVDEGERTGTNTDGHGLTGTGSEGEVR